MKKYIGETIYLKNDNDKIKQIITKKVYSSSH